MDVILLGSAAGGGFPQWNCWCPTCRAARESPLLARPRLQSSLAVSADGNRWFLCNASPDVREQLALLPRRSMPGLRHTPVEGIILTDAELDHTLGIALLREGRRLSLYATAAVTRTIECDSRILPVTRAFASVKATELPLGAPVDLHDRDDAPSGLTIEVFPVPGDPPRFASSDTPGHTIGLVIRDTATSGTCIFLPGCGALDEPLFARLATADLIFFDGTFWSDDELSHLGISNRTATEMGHLPISGVGGSLAQLARLPARHKVYTHLNNTNPVLLEQSPERKAVEEEGVEIGVDGMRYEL
jgi:pyrroloquinoline quinone biosynthesis protein B